MVHVPTLARHLAVAIVAAAIILLASIVIGDYRDYQLAQVAPSVVAVAGLTVLIGLSGQISIGNGAFMAVGGYTSALLFGHLQWPLVAILIGATCVAALTGAIFGVAAARLRGPYLAGATLMLAVALPSIATRFASVLGGDQGLGFFASVPGFLGPTFSLQRWQAWFSCGVALLVLVLLANLVRSQVGRNWRAVRDDEVAAALAGLNVARLQILAFIVSSACAGAGGMLLALVTGTVSPSLFTLGLSIQLLTAAVLGGLGSLAGAIWGSALLVFAPTYLQNVAVSNGLSTSSSPSIPIVAYGVVLIVVMLVFPSGIQGGVSRLARMTGVDGMLSRLGFAPSSLGAATVASSIVRRRHGPGAAGPGAVQPAEQQRAEGH
ncbi:MAG TPA: branched-chain amino acid ABC transporter permease [Streptosporangiaceae bacterium]|nr:branched-chain amino acid ABC transporter permease [Streptosporangiaceae bacterium]